MADRQGFEPWVGLHPQRFSRPPRSTTPAPLLSGSLDRIYPTHKRIIFAVFLGAPLFIRLYAALIWSKRLFKASLHVLIHI